MARAAWIGVSDMLAALLLIFAMAAILISWGILIGIFSGLGLGIQRAFGRREVDTTHILMAFWMGLAFVVFFLQVWHLLLPIRWWALATVSALGGAGLVWNRRQVRQYLHWVWPRRKAALIPIAILAVWLANRAIQPCATYDSGLYHLSAVRWATSTPIVPGLGNLHSRLAFNNSNLLLGAMLEVGPWYGRSNHLPNGLLLMMIFIQSIAGAFRLFKTNHEERTSGLFDLLLLTPTMLIAVHSWTSSHATDVPVALAGFVSASRLFAFLIGSRRSERDQAYDVVFVATMLAAGVCFKLTLAMFAAVAWVLVIIVWIVRARRRGFRVFPPVLIAAGTSALLILPWMSRGAILSGYPLFPSEIGSLPVEWRLPAALVADTQHGIVTLARRTRTIEGYSWLRPWAAELNREIILPAIMAVLGFLFLLVMKLSRRGGGGACRTGWAILLPIVGGIVFWFFTAPAIRFGAFLFWLLAAAIVGMCFYQLTAAAGRRTMTAVLIGALVFSTWGMKKGFRGGGSDWGFGPTPEVAMKPFQTRSGLVLWVPTEGDRCWDGPLPCTPYPNENLRLRTDGDLSSGFVIDGD